jgi:DNA-binding SARP family transcriptional activator
MAEVRGGEQLDGERKMKRFLQRFTHTADGAWAIDSNQRFVLWNPTAETELGYPAAEVMDRSCYEVLAGRDLVGNRFCKQRCPVSEAMAQGRLVPNFDLQVRTADHRLKRINISIISPAALDGKRDDQVLVSLFRPAAEGTRRFPQLRIHLLGPIVVLRPDGSQVEGSLWQRTKVRALFALLALRQGAPAHRDVLVEALWPDLEYSRALRNLNTTVYYLRRSLEPELQSGAESAYICIEGDRYLLSGMHAHWLDTDAFESGIVRARRETDPGRAVALYREALDLYRGDLMDDLRVDLFDGWMERERLCQLYLRALEELADLCEDLRQDGEAMDLCMTILAVEPCRESATHQLMRLALRYGDRVGALAHYHRLKETLWRDLRLPPSPECRHLFQIATHGELEAAMPGSEPRVADMLRIR